MNGAAFCPPEEIVNGNSEGLSSLLDFRKGSFDIDENFVKMCTDIIFVLQVPTPGLGTWICCEGVCS
jgi:hypothetical protein